MELRRLAGLTWEQLARLFDVSPRAIHSWASGEPLRPMNEERLRRALDVIRSTYRGNAASTRAALLESTDGELPLDLLAAQKFEEARTKLGVRPQPPKRKLTPLDPKEVEARRPLPPEILADSLQDQVHKGSGRGRAAKTFRARKRGPA